MESDTKFWAILMTLVGAVELAIPLGFVLYSFSNNEVISFEQAVFAIMLGYFGAIFCGFAGAYWYQYSIERRLEEHYRFTSMITRF